MSVNTENQSSGSKAKDTLLWSLVFIILAAAIVGNYMYSEHGLFLRVIGVVGAVIVAAVLAMLTGKGQELNAFARESLREVRKVVWPTRQETVQTTLIIFAVVAVMGLLLFLLDGALIWFVDMITGVKG